MMVPRPEYAELSSPRPASVTLTPCLTIMARLAEAQAPGSVRSVSRPRKYKAERTGREPPKAESPRIA
jgi:hypothetical protein